ncbi:unnamed protein product [Schistosoma curassoni]|uniref:Uncharacterized protein n=1 Tax=Schistosoma curassoni TaxID=6186 RepID=A0A183L116_9TREM|nr:unnamed protein product [Schistosoma curassoni]
MLLTKLQLIHWQSIVMKTQKLYVPDFSSAMSFLK